MRTPLVFGGLALTLIALTGCTTAADPAPAGPGTASSGFLVQADPAAPAGGVLNIQLRGDPAGAFGVDPQYASTSYGWMIYGLVYETLVGIDDSGAPQPRLAASWEMPSDTEYQFTLRDDAVFSNGRAMTVDDVVGSFERLLASDSDWVGQLGPVESVEAVDDSTVLFTLSRPYTPFLAALANTPASILPMTEIADGSVDVTKELLGTGPLVVDEHRQDVVWKLSPNPEWPGVDDLGFSAVELDIVGEEATRVAALRDGSTDLTILDTIDTLDLFGSDPEVTVVAQGASELFYTMINGQAEGSILNDEAVRFAINSAIDREQLVELVMAGSSTPTAATPAGLPDSCDPAALPSALATDEDIATALKGYTPEELAINLVVYPTNPTIPALAQVMKQQLDAVGFTVTIENIDYGTFVDRVFDQEVGDFDLAISTLAGYADASMLTNWWNVEEAGWTSVFMENNPEMNELVAEGAALPAGSAERKETLTELCELADTSSELVPLVSRPSVIGFRNDTLSPSFYAKEGYGNYFRLLTEFRAAE